MKHDFACFWNFNVNTLREGYIRIKIHLIGKMIATRVLLEFHDSLCMNEYHKNKYFLRYTTKNKFYITILSLKEAVTF